MKYYTPDEVSQP